MVNLKKTEWLLGGHKHTGATEELESQEDLVLTYRGPHSKGLNSLGIWV